jgi:type VI secretion system FHA domain protein
VLVIALTVLSYNGVPAEPLSATFDELGGTIGRSENNQLVLADPERTISRVHARVVFRASGFAIVDNGSNPIVVNGQPVGSGREHPLHEGDEVQIGGYLLKVGKAGGVPASDPFAELFGDAPMGLAGPATPPAPPPAAWPPPPPPRPVTMAAAWPSAPAPAAYSPPSAFPPPPAFPPPASPPSPASSSLGGFGGGGGSGGAAAIPDDWDPFGSEPPAPRAAPAAAPSANAGSLGVGTLGVSGTADASLDDLFGLGPAAPASGAGDLLAALSAPSAPPGTPTPGRPAEVLPPASFGFDDAFDPAYDKPRSRNGSSKGSPASVPDHASELHTPMPLPNPETTARVRPDAATAAAWGEALAPAPPPVRTAMPPAVVPPGASQPSALPSGAILSWEDPPRDGRVVTLPGVFVASGLAAPPAPAAGGLPDDFGLDLDFSPAPSAPVLTPAAALPPDSMAPVIPRAPVAAPLPVTEPGYRLGPPPAAAAPPVPASRPSAAPSPQDAAGLQAAFLAGLGVPSLRVGDLDEAQMHLLGQLLREAVRGAVELLIARAALKREMRAELTMIVARENNPLKFSPTVEVALQHLLGTPTPGFMAPAPAMRDAFDDLRAHQVGVMAGMRAALEGVLGRFDPQQLEGKLARRSAIDSLIPATRKARLWESFQELFQQLQREAQDDFDELFGRAFLQAYEAQLDRLQGDGAPR